MTHDDLYNKYPYLFERRHLPMADSCMHWGISCHDGWNDLIDQMSAELTSVAPSIQYEQIKEKFGLLRVYLHGHSNEERELAYDIIKKYEVLSGTVCETCGKTGIERSHNGWLIVQCDDCERAYHKKR